MQLNKSRRGANMLPSRCLLNLSSQRNQFCTMFNFCEVLILLTLWQPTLLLHNRPTVSYTPAAPARCPELARNHRNIDKYCSSVEHIRRLTCTYVQLPTPADTHPHRHAPLKLRAHRRDVFQQSQQQKKKQRQSELSKVTVWHKVCFVPNALPAYTLTSHSVTSCPAYCFLHPAHLPRASWIGQGFFFFWDGKYFLYQLKLFWQRYRWTSWRNVLQ